jgi:hypothetical protein
VADTLDLAFSSPDGETFGFQWDEDELAGLGPQGAEEKPKWELVGQVDWDEIEAIRVLSARLDDGRILALAALRPAGAEGHEGEVTAAALRGDGDVESFDEVRLSTQYDGDGGPRRIGLELFAPGRELPLRAAGDAGEPSSAVEGGVKVLRAPLSFRLDGTPGFALYEILTAAS